MNIYLFVCYKIHKINKKELIKRTITLNKNVYPLHADVYNLKLLPENQTNNHVSNQDAFLNQFLIV